MENAMPTDLKSSIASSLAEARSTLDVFIADADNLARIEGMADALVECFQAGGKVLTCGNGGSACDAMHFAEECTGRFRKDRKALPVIPLLDSSYLTCVSNDYGYDHVFSRGVEAYGKPGDVLLAISTSGNSANVVKAVEAARKLGVRVHLFLGKDGGALRGRGDEEIWVRSSDTERVQEVHMTVLHILIESLERRMFPENYRG